VELHGLWLPLWRWQCTSSAAFAQTALDASELTTSSDTAEDPTLVRAREAFLLGTALAREGQWLDALAAFERSARLRAHPVTTYNLAYCERALGHYTRAQQLFSLALNEHAEKKGGVLTEDLLAQTQSYLAEIERRLARATITVSPAGATVTVDGRGLEKARSSSGLAVYIAAMSESVHAAAPAGAFELLLDPASTCSWWRAREHRTKS
jgi:tetratricopeptide (TPR) repeat protein